VKKQALDGITKISQSNLDRIAALKVSGYEPNDYIISLALDILEKNEYRKEYKKVDLRRTTKIFRKTMKRMKKLKGSNETNDAVIDRALDLLERERQ
jgi:hypothetical protein